MTPNLDLDHPHQAEAEQDEGKGLEAPGRQAHDTHVQEIPVACLLIRATIVWERMEMES